MPSALLDRRLVVVTGKGGVGKSSVAAALAVLAARAGKRVLVCEVNAQERVAPLLGAPPAGPTVRAARPGLHTVDVTPAEAMREYGLMILRFRAVYEAVFENRLVRHFLRVVPSLGELVMLGKILHEARAEVRGRPRWDLVVLDAPSTGHCVQLLRVPGAMLGTVPPGPLRSDALWMRDWLVDPARTALALVTLPEEMPVTEAIELDAALRAQVGLAPAALVVNAMPPARFSAAEAARLPGLADGPPPLGPAARAGRLQAVRAEASAREAARARAALDLPTTLLPLLASPTFGAPEVERLADVLGAPGPGEPAWLAPAAPGRAP
ncbi:MAG: AAA family ATPase [Anaeromyxobacter sp.]|nr:AAA family ATPase [Anaeromyxobacter sp.]MBL0277398.1 AAA family ATPase [Anaeromyxobacter sp.]